MAKTRIIFRKFKEGDIIALFPSEPHNHDISLCMSYQHIGQHGAASVDLSSCTTRAKPKEYEPLARELIELGYDLIVRKRFTVSDRRMRQANIMRAK